MKKTRKDYIQKTINLLKQENTITINYSKNNEVVGGYFYTNDEGLLAIRRDALNAFGLNTETVEYLLTTKPQERAELKRLARIAALKKELRDLEELTPNEKQP